jgi:glycosyltransferase involved in cell wall biosynthesis
MEAMAAGIPVVATNIPGNRELIAPHESGVLVAVGDRAGFAARTREILQDAVLAQRLGQGAHQRITTHFGAEMMLDGYESLYRSLLSSK